MATGSKPRVFLDSNVIFSGLHSPEGAPGEILTLFIRGEIVVVVSPQVLEEAVRTLKTKLHTALPLFKTMLLSVPPIVATDPSPKEITLWREYLSLGDAAVFTAAVSARPDYFVTGDSHFTGNPDLAEKAKLRIVTPAQFLRHPPSRHQELA